MSFPKQKIEKNLYSLEAVLNFLDELLSSAHKAEVVVRIARSALDTFKGRLDGDNALAASEMIDKLRDELAMTDADIDRRLAAKFDTGGSDA